MLILDEPTNHLDIESREALEDALRAFPGSLLLVSHDRALLDAVGSRTVAVEDGSLHSYEGGWAEYVRVREERRAEQGNGAGGPRRGAGAGVDAAVVKPARAGHGQDDQQQRRAAGKTGATQESSAGSAASSQRAANKPAGPSKNRVREQQKAERAVEDAEAALQALEQELADPAAWATKYEAAKSEARHTAAKRAVEAAYDRLGAADRLTLDWDDVMDRLHPHAMSRSFSRSPRQSTPCPGWAAWRTPSGRCCRWRSSPGSSTS